MVATGKSVLMLDKRPKILYASPVMQAAKFESVINMGDVPSAVYTRAYCQPGDVC
ncbi:MAG: hypothetical protein HND51_12830 [Chloroflexi bacterium]|nr:hypothetical protein [Chloroflexota bacterium]